MVLAIAACVVGIAEADGGYSLTARTALGVLVWWAIGVAVVSGVAPGLRHPRAAIAPWLALALFAAWTGLSIRWAASSEKAYNELDRVLLYLGVFTLGAVLAVPSRLRVWRDGLALGIASVGLLALVSRFFPGTLGGTRDRLAPDAPPQLSRRLLERARLLVGAWFPATAHARRRRRACPGAGNRGRRLPGLDSRHLPDVVPRGRRRRRNRPGRCCRRLAAARDRRLRPRRRRFGVGGRDTGRGTPRHNRQPSARRRRRRRGPTGRRGRRACCACGRYRLACARPGRATHRPPAARTYGRAPGEYFCDSGRRRVGGRSARPLQRVQTAANRNGPHLRSNHVASAQQ